MLENSGEKGGIPGNQKRLTSKAEKTKSVINTHR
jgi:hypothetical protein